MAVDGLFIRIRGNVQGPYDQDELQSLIRRGQLSRIHEISEDGHKWVRAEEYPHLFVSVTPAVSWRPTPVEIEPEDSYEPDAPVTEATSPPKLSKQEWYYLLDDEQRGPCSAEELRSQLRSGPLKWDDLVWSEGMPDWVSANQVQALQERVESPQRPVTIVTRTAERPTRRRISSLAIFSFVCALLWLGGVGSLLAIVLGGLALQQIRDSGGRLSGSGLAATGLILGSCLLVATVVVGISVAMMIL